MKATIVLAAIALFPDATMNAAEARGLAVGELVCSVAAPGATSHLAASTDVTAGTAARKLHCILRDRETGTSDVYGGTLQLLKNLKALSVQSTLLWNVTVDRASKAKVNLDQNFDLEADKAQKSYVVVTGEEQPGVRLMLEKTKAHKALQDTLLGLKLKLADAAT